MKKQTAKLESCSNEDVVSKGYLDTKSSKYWVLYRT